MRRFIVFFLFCISLSTANAQHATVEEYNIEVQCKSLRQVICSKRTVTRILDEKGSSEANFLCTLGTTDQLLDFRGQVCDAEGRILHKFKKSDLERSEYTSMLAVDAYMLGLTYTPPTFPVTVTYEWTVKYTDDILEFPLFVPQESYDVNVRKAHYQITIPTGIVCRHSFQNIEEHLLKTTDDGDMQTMELTLENLPAIRHLEYARPVQSRIPIARFIPSRFYYFGKEGSLDSWMTYGLWTASLMQEHDVLPEALCNRVRALVKGCTNDRERVELIYQFLGQTTRYVSIQLGIGGHQPAPAAEVGKSGYGDCKALSNYMKALLAAVGIPSTYIEIGTDYPQLNKQIPIVGQLNHAILQVPLPQDTLWIECTNPKLPLGYIHSRIAGHDAVRITDKGGYVCRLPSYPDSLNAQYTSVRMKLQADGSVGVSIMQRSHLRQYEFMRALLDYSRKEQQYALSQIFRFPQLSFSTIEATSEGCVFNLHTELVSKNYANRSGQRLFLPLSPLHKGYTSLPVDPERQEPIYVASGYKDVDTIFIELPEGYLMESLPEPIELHNDVGCFDRQVSMEGDTLCIVQQLLIRSGTYPVDKYAQISDFLKKVGTCYAGKAVLRKE